MPPPWQQGVNGYIGTQDAAISNQSGGNGSTDFTGTYVRCLTSTYSIEDILKFTNLGIPTNATVLSAQLTLTLDSWQTVNPTFTGYYVNGAWNGLPGNGLGWLYRSSGNAWNTPRCFGPGHGRDLRQELYLHHHGHRRAAIQNHHVGHRRGPELGEQSRQQSGRGNCERRFIRRHFNGRERDELEASLPGYHL